MAGIGSFLWNNLTATLTPTGTGTTPVVGLGFSQFQDPQPRHRCRFATTTPSIVWDLGSSVSCDCLALISTSLTGADSIRIRCSDADPTCVGSLLYDSGVVGNVTNTAWNGNVVRVFAAVTARYWRVDLVCTNPCDIGMFLLGKLFRPGINFDYNCQEGYIDLAQVDRNQDTGALFGVAGPLLRTRIVTYGQLLKFDVRTDHGSLVCFGDIDIFVGAGKALLWIDDPDEPDPYLMAANSIYGTYRSTGPDLTTWRHLDYWSRTFNITERL